MKRSGAAHTRPILTAAILGTVVTLSGALVLSGCSGSKASPPDSAGGASSAGASGASPGGGGDTSLGGGANPSGGATVGGGGATVGGGGATVAGGGTGNGGDTGGGAGGGGTLPPFDAGTDPARNQVPGGQVCDRIATIQCAGEAHCCNNPGRTVDQCKQTMKDGCVNTLYLDAITSNSVAGYDTAGAEAIFTTFEQMASTCDPGVTAWGASFTGLRALVKGTLSSGASCEPSVSQLANKAVDAAYLASCTDPTTSACFPTALSWTCSPRGNSGSKCFTDTNCADNLYCTNSSTNPSITGGKCQARKASGQTCALLNECASLLCKQGMCVDADQQTAYCLNAN